MRTPTTQTDTEMEKGTDPKELGAKPPFPEQNKISPPGHEAKMHPTPDHGENSYRGSGKLTGKAALITGADSGIGRAVALAFAREGADVLIAYLNEDDDARETERLVTEAGRKAVVIPGDIRGERHCQELVQRCVRELGSLDILVNNAAYQKTFSDIAEITADEFDRAFRTNVFATFFLCQAALAPGGMGEGGSIINTASIQAYQPDWNLLPYAATKAAIVDMTKGLAKLAVKKGIRVNAVAPGPVWTPLIPSTMPAEKVKEFGKDSPMERPAQPRELAPIYVLLASAEASYVTGAVYPVTGGTPTA